MNGMQFTPQDWGQLALMGGLSILGNNNGNRSVGQLIGQGGLDALAGLQARKQYEAAMERQRQEDERAQAQHDLQMRQGNAELEAAARRAQLEQAAASGNEDAIKALAPLEWWKNKQRQAQDALNHKRALEIVDRRNKLTTIQPEFLPLDAAARKELAGLSQLDGFTSYLEDAFNKAYTPDENGFKQGGTGLVEGFMPNWARARIDPHGNEFRSALSNFSSQVMNWLSGAAVSEQERVRLEGFLPTVYDDEDTLRAKIKGYRDFVRSKGESWRNVYGDHDAFGRMRTFAPKKSENKKNADIPKLPEGFEMVQ